MSIRCVPSVSAKSIQIMDLCSLEDVDAQAKGHQDFYNLESGTLVG